jgi:hypothetical protein
VKINSPQAESSRAQQRVIDKREADKCATFYGPYWSLEGAQLVAVNMARRLQASIKREEQYVRIIKRSAKPPRPKKCLACEKRRRAALIRKRTSKGSPCNREEALKVIASIEECWPGFRKIPDVLWNQYIDECGKCRCGRPLAPKRVSKSAKAAFCCREHAEKYTTQALIQRRRLKVMEQKAIAEAM